MGLFRACFGKFDESKGQKDLNLTKETIDVYNRIFL